MSPLIAGYLQDSGPGSFLFKLPFIIAGTLKCIYDILLYVSFQVNSISASFLLSCFAYSLRPLSCCVTSFHCCVSHCVVRCALQCSKAPEPLAVSRASAKPLLTGAPQQEVASSPASENRYGAIDLERGKQSTAYKPL